MWGTDPSNVFVEVHPFKTGQASDVRIWDGRTWDATTLGKSNYLLAIHGVALDDVWVVGYRVDFWGKGAQVYHYDGEVWSELAPPIDRYLTDVYARAKDDVWISGKRGTLQHYDGAQWQVIDVGTEEDITDVHAPPGGPVLITVGHQRVLRLDTRGLPSTWPAGRSPPSP